MYNNRNNKKVDLSDYFRGNLGQNRKCSNESSQCQHTLNKKGLIEVSIKI